MRRRRRDDPYGTLYGFAYDFSIEREWLARALTRLLFESDMRPLYGSMVAIGAAGEGATILDVPCGAGVAFRALSADQRVRYLAVDSSPAMLRRARRQATRRELGQVELVRANAKSLPIESESVDLCLCYAGLHCFADPAAALSEVARCLRPEGRLIGTMMVEGSSWRADRVIALYRRRGIFGPGGSAADLERWLTVAGLNGVSVESHRAVAIFRAHARR